MTPQALFVLVAWLPLTLYFFACYSPRKAIILSFVGGLLFLPQRTGISLLLIPNYTGITAACYGILIGIVCFDFKRLSTFKLGWIDIPMIIWCICPFFASMTNDLGPYDGLNIALTQIVTWGLPYWLGRLYFNSLAGLKELAIGMIVGGLIYVPLCLYEIRLSPQIHYLVYGFFPHPSGLSQAFRYGGWRPQVFMSHGLVLGMWMMVVTLLATWLWRAGTVRQIQNIPIKWVAIVLIITFIFAKSTGAYFYLLLGVAILFVGVWSRNSWLLFLTMAGIIYYLYLGVTGSFHGQNLVGIFGNLVDPDRLDSLKFRFENEELLRVKAAKKLLFGWGEWGRSRIYEENWEGDVVDVSVTDSFWIIIFGTTGIVGLISWISALLLPVILFVTRRYSAKTWIYPQVAPAAALAICLVLFAIDSLVNATFNATFPLISGGLAGLALQPAPTKKRIPKTIAGINIDG